MLVFTFGFLSILCFGAVLATSGTITTHLGEDFVIRLKFRIFANKIVMAIVWGLLWIGLLFVIAGYAIQWNVWRMDEKMTLEEGIWFAYIRSVFHCDVLTEPVPGKKKYQQMHSIICHLSYQHHNYRSVLLLICRLMGRVVAMLSAATFAMLSMILHQLSHISCISTLSNRFGRFLSLS